ncbi:uncharacterized protein LOC115223152 [Argonauta hians]
MLQEEKAAQEYICNVSDEDRKAYNRNLTAHQKGISREKMTEAYNEWADRYENDLGPNRYRGPDIVAQTLTNLFHNEATRATIKIIDVAAGSGLLGEKLRTLNFQNIDALDPSDGLLEVAKKKQVYTNFFCKYFDLELDIPNDSYDLLVISGGMGEGHIPASAVPKMADLVKPGGHVVIVMRKEYLSYVLDYKDKLIPMFKSLEEEKKWLMVSKEEVQNYSFKKPGLVFVFKVL